MIRVSEKKLRGIQIVKGKENPLTWAEGRSGYVTLHHDELDILKALMETLREPNVEEYDLALLKGRKKKKFYRLFVRNLSAAFEIINMARMIKISLQ
jgi:hypothetical protein